MSEGGMAEGLAVGERVVGIFLEAFETRRRFYERWQRAKGNANTYSSSLRIALGRAMLQHHTQGVLPGREQLLGVARDLSGWGLSALERFGLDLASEQYGSYEAEAAGRASELLNGHEVTVDLVRGIHGYNVYGLKKERGGLATGRGMPDGSITGPFVGADMHDYSLYLGHSDPEVTWRVEIINGSGQPKVALSAQPLFGEPSA